MQPQVHTKAFKGRNCSTFSQQPQAARATCWGKAGGISQMPQSFLHQQWSEGLTVTHCMQFTSLPSLIFQKPLAAGLCFQTLPQGQTFMTVGAAATTPHMRHPPDFLYGDRMQREAGCDRCCLAAAVWKQDAKPQTAAWARGVKWGETVPHTVLHFKSLQACIWRDSPDQMLER